MYFFHTAPSLWHPMNPMRHYQTGQLDYKDHRIMRKPYFTVADNWKPVTSEEQIAMKERNEIAGRNRRYYWKLLLNPKYGDRHFAEAVTDSQYAKWNRINSQFWYIFNVRPDRRDVIKSVMQIYVLQCVGNGDLVFNRLNDHELISASFWVQNHISSRCRVILDFCCCR